MGESDDIIQMVGLSVGLRTKQPSDTVPRQLLQVILIALSCRVAAFLFFTLFSEVNILALKPFRVWSGSYACWRTTSGHCSRSLSGKHASRRGLASAQLE